MDLTTPDYGGASLVNLIAEIEQRLGGSPPSPGLHGHLATLIPDAATYVLCLFDGLGARQLGHDAAAPLRESCRAELDSPFPATTTVSLATLATGLPPSQHGLLGYQAWLPEIATVVNTIHWTTLWGDPVAYDLPGFLPAPNLAERLAGAGVEAVTVQPAQFLDTNLTRVLFRGCRFEGVHTVVEWVDAVTQLAAVPNRLVVAYLPNIDYAAHVAGQASAMYRKAMSTLAGAWEQLCYRLPSGAAAIATADHGHIDFPPDRQVKIAKADHEGHIFFGDGRAMFVKGDGADLATRLPARWIPLPDMIGWWGPAPRHPELPGRLPDGVLLADDGYLLLHKHSDTRMIGNHGGLADAERLIPLMVGADRADDPGSP
jgi:hypothetical protein